ncbi:MAG: hypothetical protein K2X48_16845 [Chitinophagaceae bacterium]|nr:hypothetical protein [Chitinophagaceae bacterium]
MDQNETVFKLEVEETSSRFLSETAKWAKFLSILGFVLTGIIVIIAIFAGTFLASMSGGMSESVLPAGFSIIITIVYLAFALLYFFPCLYLYRFSSKMKQALLENNQVQLNSSFENLKSCFKFMGIMAIVIISIYILLFLFGGLASLMR